MRAREFVRPAARSQAACSALGRAREGDGAALAELLARSRDRVLTVCCRLLGDRADGEDAAQEAMLKVALHLHELKEEEQFGSWCWRIAHRICMDRLRTGRRRQGLLAARREPAGESAEERTVGRMVVRQILAAMPDDMSEALILREMEGQPYSEIARRLAVPLGTAKSRLHAARRRFRRDYLKAMQEEG